ncbi:hypothetical protein QJQ45_011764 [Haematococcus lacustris]|nr:hypothetical protein QJQ45_011764 [Haematococcus lacustris]
MLPTALLQMLPTALLQVLPTALLQVLPTALLQVLPTVLLQVLPTVSRCCSLHCDWSVALDDLALQRCQFAKATTIYDYEWRDHLLASHSLAMQQLEGLYTQVELQYKRGVAAHLPLPLPGLKLPSVQGQGPSITPADQAPQLLQHMQLAVALMETLHWWGARNIALLSHAPLELAAPDPSTPRITALRAARLARHAARKWGFSPPDAHMPWAPGRAADSTLVTAQGDTFSSSTRVTTAPERSQVAFGHDGSSPPRVQKQVLQDGCTTPASQTGRVRSSPASSPVPGSHASHRSPGTEPKVWGRMAQHPGSSPTYLSGFASPTVLRRSTGLWNTTLESYMGPHTSGSMPHPPPCRIAHADDTTPTSGPLKSSSAGFQRVRCPSEAERLGARCLCPLRDQAPELTPALLWSLRAAGTAAHTPAHCTARFTSRYTLAFHLAKYHGLTMIRTAALKKHRAQGAALLLKHWAVHPPTPPPAKRSKPAAVPTKGKAQGKAATAKPAPQPGRWMDRDCNAALNMQRIGESKWRPLELCYWPEQGALPAKGKEYPGWATSGQEPDPAWSQQRDQPVRGLMWCPVVAPRKPPQAPCSSQAATQPAASEPGPSTPLPAKRSKRTKAEQAAELTQPTQPTTGKGKAAKAKPAPQPGRWLDRDCNAALNMQRNGESRWRPLELCWWPEQTALPAKGKEYPGLGYKRLRDWPPEAEQQQQQEPAVAQ